MKIIFVNVSPNIGQEKTLIKLGFIINGIVYYFPRETTMLEKIKNIVFLYSQQAETNIKPCFPKTEDEITFMTCMPTTKNIFPLNPSEINDLRSKLNF